MNETIGVKGGKRDRRRRMIITRNQKKRLLAYYKRIRELEANNKKQTIFPNSNKNNHNQEKISPQSKNTVTSNKESNPPIKKNQESIKQSSSIDIKTAKTNISKPTQKASTTHIKTSPPKAVSPKISLPSKNTILKSPSSNTKKSPKKSPSKAKITIVSPPKSIKKKKNKFPLKTASAKEKQLVESSKIVEKQPIETPKPVEILPPIKGFEEDNLSKHQIKTLQDLKNRKIIDVYEKKLKDLRFDLRNIIFEYNAIAEEANSLYESKKAQELIDKLNEVIKKIETLKSQIKIADIDKYDDNYIYTLIENYIEEFKEASFVSDIKDSELYSLISSKIEELDTKKNSLNKKVTQRKDYLKEKEVNFDSLKEKYYDYDKFNKTLISFQNDQDKLLKELNEKLANATTIEEKVEVKVETLNKQNSLLFKLIGLQLFLPGPRSAKRLTTLAALYMYYMNNIMKPKTTTHKYKVVKVKDYSKEIENSISSIEEIDYSLKRTSRKLDKMINNFKTEYQEFFGVIPGCKKLLQNLEKVKDSIKEKEYELDKIKTAQIKNLERNNAKVLRYQK